MDKLTKAREMFSKDIYATDRTGIIIDDVKSGYCQCSVTINETHKNAYGGVMGGVIFTLADFAFAVAANIDGDLTVALTANITYLSQTKGEKLIATASEIKSGRSTCYYIVDVFDDLSNRVASVSINGFKI